MTKNILWTVLVLGALGINISYAQFSPSCSTPDGTWKEDCSLRHTLTQDGKGCTFIASCDGKETSYTWPLSGGSPLIDYTSGALVNQNEKKSCAA